MYHLPHFHTADIQRSEKKSRKAVNKMKKKNLWKELLPYDYLCCDFFIYACITEEARYKLSIHGKHLPYTTYFYHTAIL